MKSSRTDLHDDVVDVTSFSALDVVEINTNHQMRAMNDGGWKNVSMEAETT